MSSRTQAPLVGAAALTLLIAVGSLLPARAIEARGPRAIINTVLTLQVVAVDPEITQIALGDRFTIDFDLDDATVDTNASAGAGRFPGLLTSASMTADIANAGAWTPSGVFDLGAASNFVTNAGGDGVTLQIRGAGFPDGAPGWAFHDVDLGISFPDIVDTGVGQTFADQLLPSVFGIPPGVTNSIGIRFTDGDDFPAATLQPATAVPVAGPTGLFLLALALIAAAWFMVHRRNASVA